MNALHPIRRYKLLFLAFACALLVVFITETAHSQSVANVTVKLAQPLAQLPPGGLGVCTATYDNVLIDSRIPPLLKAAGISGVRYPGGSYADIFNWQTTTANEGGYVNANDTFAHFMNTVVNPAGAQAIVTINYGSNPAGNAGGDTNVAASWVAYAFNVDYQILHDDILNESQVSAHAYYGAQMAHLLANTNDTLVAATSDKSLVHVHAASRQDGRVGVMLLNTSRTATNTVNVSISGSPLATDGIEYTFGATNFIGANDSPSYPVATNAASGLGNSFTIAVPPYTMIDLLIPPAPTPPVLAAISNRTVNVGEIVSFTASATDTNLPPPTLSFSLLSAPTNASVDSASGLFNWRPLVSQANSTNQFALAVTANNTPSLSATQSFAVTVNPITLPTLTQAAMSNGQFSFTLDGMAGPDYGIQVSSNLTDWQTVFSTNSPALPLTWLDSNSPAPLLFYRATVGPPLPP